MPSRSSRPRPQEPPPPPQPSFEELLFPAAATSSGSADSLCEPHGRGAGPLLDPGARQNSAASPAAALAGGGLAALVPVYGVKLVRTDTLALRERLQVHRPADVAALLEKHLAGADREHFVALLLDIKNRLIGLSPISIGDLNAALVHPREVFKPAILANAASILLGHNHPSGNTDASPEDIAVTRRLAEAGEILGIAVLDHVIVGERGAYRSLKESGYL